nr:MAG TPA: hypothetical protein [Caudoviricetes sp.]
MAGGGGIEPLSSIPLFSYEFRRLVWGHRPYLYTLFYKLSYKRI